MHRSTFHAWGRQPKRHQEWAKAWRVLWSVRMEGEGHPGRHFIGHWLARTVIRALMRGPELRREIIVALQADMRELSTLEPGIVTFLPEGVRFDPITTPVNDAEFT